MPWYCVYIPSQAASKASAWSLIRMATELYQKAGEPQDISVFHAFSGDGHNLFYFSPRAKELFPELLRFFDASLCNRPQVLEKMTPILGPLTPPPEE